MNDFKADLIIAIAQAMLSRWDYVENEEEFASQVLKYAHAIENEVNKED